MQKGTIGTGSALRHGARLGVALFLALAIGASGPVLAATPEEVADYVRDNLLDGWFGDINLWMTDTPLDYTYVARDWAEGVPDEPFPSAGEWDPPCDYSWLVMIDGAPGEPWGHPCYWVWVNDDLTGDTGLVEHDFPPAIIGDFGAGEEIQFGCVELTSYPCGGEPPALPDIREEDIPIAADKDCLYAVLVSGGIRRGVCRQGAGADCTAPPHDCPAGRECVRFGGAGDYFCHLECEGDQWGTCPAGDGNCTGANNKRYADNLTSIYQKLRACGYPKNQIWVYYSDGTKELDFDGGGNDVTGAASEANIRGKIQQLCATLDPERDILFIYVTNHGTHKRCKGGTEEGKLCSADGDCAGAGASCAGNSGICLWDSSGNRKLEAGEVYAPDEFAADTADCDACRLFVIMDQCYSGLFTSLAGDGNHGDTAIYTAASSIKPSWGRQYPDSWEDLDPAANTINEMHESVADDMKAKAMKCSGGGQDGYSCAGPADCPGGGTCELEWECVGGGSAGNACAGSSDCPGGECVCKQRCEGGTEHGDACKSEADCPNGHCTPYTSAPQSAEGTPGNGDVSICECCEPDPHATATEPASWIRLGTPTYPGLPSGFFGPLSDPWDGDIMLVGSTIDESTSGNASTLVQRSDVPVWPDDPTGTVGTVDLEIVDLRLVSFAPIVVTQDGGLDPQEWSVLVELSDVSPTPVGHLTATKTHANGGTYDSVLYVQPKFIFTKVSDPGEVRTFDTGLDGLPALELVTTEAPFVHDLDASLESGVVAPHDGRFVPGIEETTPGDTSSQVLTTVEALDLTAEAWHWIYPPIWPPPYDPHATWTGSPSQIEFGVDGGTIPAIPAGFFGPGSDPFDGIIYFDGEPIDPAAYGDASTLVQRSGYPAWPGDPDGTIGGATLEIVALNLVSAAPITVSYNGGTDTEDWDVSVDLSEVPPAETGFIAATKEHVNGGVFDSVLYVQPRFTFVKVSDPLDVRVLDAGLWEFAPLRLVTNQAPFVFSVEPTLGVVAPDDGLFVPGVSEAVPGDPLTQELFTIVTEDWFAPAIHYVFPPIWPPVEGACCVEETCVQTTAVECLYGGGLYQGDFVLCDPDPCQDPCKTIAEARALGIGIGVQLCEVVVSSTTDLVAADTVKNFHVQDDTGGITVFGDNAVIDPILDWAVEGDAVSLFGTTDEFNSLFELVDDTVALELAGTPGHVGVPTPIPVGVADFQDGSPTAEGLESMLVKLDGVVFTEAGTFAMGNYDVTADWETFATVRVSTNDLDLFDQPIPTGPVNITGIFSQYSMADPAAGYQLLVRRMADLEELGGECVAQDCDSCRNHGFAERLCLNMGVSGGVEPRLRGILELDITVDDASVFSGGVTVDCQSCPWAGEAVSSVNGSTITVALTPALPDQCCCTVTLDCGAEVCVCGLEGDIDRSSLVSTGDASIIKPHFGDTPTEADAVFDFDVSGLISTGDFSQVKPKFGNSAPECP